MNEEIFTRLMKALDDGTPFEADPVLRACLAESPELQAQAAAFLRQERLLRRWPVAERSDEAWAQWRLELEARLDEVDAGRSHSGGVVAPVAADLDWLAPPSYGVEGDGVSPPRAQAASTWAGPSERAAAAAVRRLRPLAPPASSPGPPPAGPPPGLTPRSPSGWMPAGVAATALLAAAGVFLVVLVRSAAPPGDAELHAAAPMRDGASAGRSVLEAVPRPGVGPTPAAGAGSGPLGLSAERAESEAAEFAADADDGLETTGAERRRGASPAAGPAIAGRAPDPLRERQAAARAQAPSALSQARGGDAEEDAAFAVAASGSLAPGGSARAAASVAGPAARTEGAAPLSNGPVDRGTRGAIPATADRAPPEQSGAPLADVAASPDPAAPPIRRRPSALEVQRELARIGPALARCVAERPATLSVRLVFRSAGMVDAVTWGAPLPARADMSCLTEGIRRAQVMPFQEARFPFAYTYRW